MHPTQSSTKKKKQTMPNPSPPPPPYYITSTTPQPTATPAAESSARAATRPPRKNKQTPPPPPYKAAVAEGEVAKPPPTAARKKGESRVLLPLSVLEEAVFGSRSDPERSFGRRRNRAFRGMREDGQWRSVDMEGDSDGEGGAGAVRPEPISTWEGAEDFDGDDQELQGGVRLDEDDEGGIVRAEAETPELEAKRRAGQKKAEEREFIRCVVRRAVVFGVEVVGWEEVGGSGGGGGAKKGKRGKGRDEEEDEAVEDEVKPRRKCEAIMAGQVVEPSFAKGDWSVRWRDE